MWLYHCLLVPKAIAYALLYLFCTFSGCILPADSLLEVSFELSPSEESTSDFLPVFSWRKHTKKIKCPIQLLVLQLRMCQFLTGITVVEWVKCHILPCRYANGKPGRILHCSLIYQLQTIRGESLESIYIHIYIYICCAVTEESTSKQQLFILCGCLYVKYVSTYQRSDYRNQWRLITATGITPCGVYHWNLDCLVLTLIQMSVTGILSCYSQTYFIQLHTAICFIEQVGNNNELKARFVVFILGLGFSGPLNMVSL